MELSSLITVTDSDWTDLGLCPVLVSLENAISCRFQIQDTKPGIGDPGFILYTDRYILRSDVAASSVQAWQFVRKVLAFNAGHLWARSYTKRTNLTVLSLVKTGAISTGAATADLSDGDRSVNPMI